MNILKMGVIITQITGEIPEEGSDEPKMVELLRGALEKTVKRVLGTLPEIQLVAVFAAVGDEKFWVDVTLTETIAERETEIERATLVYNWRIKGIWDDPEISREKLEVFIANSIQETRRKLGDKTRVWSV